MKLNQFATAAAALSLTAAASALTPGQPQSAAQEPTTRQFSQATSTAMQSDAQLVRDVQRHLNQNGERIPIDGQWSPRMREAVKDFQGSRGIQANGQLSQPTLSMLGVSGHDGGASLGG